MNEEACPGFFLLLQQNSILPPGSWRGGRAKKEGETSNNRKKKLSNRLNICVLEQNIEIKSKIFVQSIEMKDSYSAHIDKYDVVRK